MNRDRQHRLAEQAAIAADHRASLARQMAQPKGFGGLLTWFLEGFRSEVPEDVHKSGVWRDYVRIDEERHGEGGSLLGSPALADGFRRFIEGSAFATESSQYEGHQSREGDEHYAMPMRAALARLAGRGDDVDEYPFMARTLYRTAIRGGDWDAACASMGIVAPVRRTYVQSALVRLWRRYSVQPPARVLREEAPAA